MGVGLGADVVVVRNQANAYIGNGAQVSAHDDIDVVATSTKRVQSYVLAFGGGGTVGVAGSVAVMAIGSIVDSESKGRLSGSDDKGNSGSAWTAADSRTEGSQVGGQLGQSSEATEAKTTLGNYADERGVAGSFKETTVLTDRTQALIGEQAVVDAGRDVSVLAKETTETRIGAGSIAAGGNVSVGGSIGIALIDNSAEATIGSRATVNAARKLEVVATTGESLHSIGVAGGGAAYVAVNGSIINQTILSDTLATIAPNAQINTDDDQEDDQQVEVRADSQTKTFSLAGDGGGAIAGIGASANITTIAKHTQAAIAERATVNAQKAIFVDALSREDILAVTVSAQGGAAGIGGVASPQTIANRTLASIGNHAVITSPGNVRVQSANDTEIDAIPLAGQVGGVTVGGALGLNTITSTTRSSIGDFAQVTALGTQAAMDIFDGTTTASETAVDAKTTSNSDGSQQETTSYQSSTLAREPPPGEGWRSSPRRIKISLPPPWDFPPQLAIATPPPPPSPRWPLPLKPWWAMPRSMAITMVPPRPKR